MIKDRSSAERKAALKRIREEGERRCLKELNALADGARCDSVPFYSPVFFLPFHPFVLSGSLVDGARCRKVSLLCF